MAQGNPIRISDVRSIIEDKILFYVENAWYVIAINCLWSYHNLLLTFLHRDKEGRPIIFWDAARYFVDKIPEPALIKALVYALERITER